MKKKWKQAAAHIAVCILACLLAAGAVGLVIRQGEALPENPMETEVADPSRMLLTAGNVIPLNPEKMENAGEAEIHPAQAERPRRRSSRKVKSRKKNSRKRSLKSREKMMRITRTGAERIIQEGIQAETADRARMYRLHRREVRRLRHPEGPV